MVSNAFIVLVAVFFTVITLGGSAIGFMLNERWHFLNFEALPLIPTAIILAELTGWWIYVTAT